MDLASGPAYLYYCVHFNLNIFYKITWSLCTIAVRNWMNIIFWSCSFPALSQKFCIILDRSAVTVKNSYSLDLLMYVEFSANISQTKRSTLPCISQLCQALVELSKPNPLAHCPGPHKKAAQRRLSWKRWPPNMKSLAECVLSERAQECIPCKCSVKWWQFFRCQLWSFVRWGCNLLLTTEIWAGIGGWCHSLGMRVTVCVCVVDRAVCL